MRFATLCAFLLAMLAQSARATVFPCTLSGIEQAVATGGGPHALDCTPGETIVVPASQPALSITGDVTLDFGGVTLAFDRLGGGVLGIGPSVDCTGMGCVRGPSVVHLSDFTLQSRSRSTSSRDVGRAGSTR